MNLYLHTCSASCSTFFSGRRFCIRGQLGMLFSWSKL
ncbi:hypothetical protein MANES_06G096550v8 [Manihot esculenta]|uniref:Uncharacterized protein n=1 Tax=Manihot esculenta TaxID=3983 RepID=A0ACB7HIP1_MANES|nr:hypothetical protein MANES_06G096550v8 [Manihot esculenta]